MPPTCIMSGCVGEASTLCYGVKYSHGLVVKEAERKSWEMERGVVSTAAHTNQDGSK